MSNIEQTLVIHVEVERQQRPVDDRKPPSRRRLDGVHDAYQGVGDRQRDEARVRRLLQVVHRVAETLPGEHEQVEAVSEYSEERDDRHKNLDDARDVHMLRSGRAARTDSIQKLADVFLELVANECRSRFNRGRRFPARLFHYDVPLTLAHHANLIRHSADVKCFPF